MVLYLDSVGPFAHDAALCLKEFSKSLVGRAYTWYINLKSGSIHCWVHLISSFDSKFFCVEVKSPHPPKLGRTT